MNSSHFIHGNPSSIRIDRLVLADFSETRLYFSCRARLRSSFRRDMLNEKIRRFPRHPSRRFLAISSQPPHMSLLPIVLSIAISRFPVGFRAGFGILVRFLQETDKIAAVLLAKYEHECLVGDVGGIPTPLKNISQLG